jgi:hypothetical protein
MTQREKLDIESIDPGLRRTVLWLKSLGFHTEAATENDADQSGLAFVHVRTTPERLIPDADRLCKALRQIGALVCKAETFEGAGCWVAATYEPVDSGAVLTLVGFDDSALPAPADDLAKVTDEALSDTKNLRDMNQLAREPEARRR